jgi:hypothetical protein
MGALGGFTLTGASPQTTIVGARGFAAGKVGAVNNRTGFRFVAVGKGKGRTGNGSSWHILTG